MFLKLTYAISIASPYQRKLLDNKIGSDMISSNPPTVASFSERPNGYNYVDRFQVLATFMYTVMHETYSYKPHLTSLLMIATYIISNS